MMLLFHPLKIKKRNSHTNEKQRTNRQQQKHGTERSPSALRAIQDFLKSQVHTKTEVEAVSPSHPYLYSIAPSPVPQGSVHVPLSAADMSEGLYLGPHPAASPHPAPSPGLLLLPQQTAYPPPPSPLREQVDFEVEILFRALCPRNLVLVFLALLLECKVLLVSERLTLLIIAGEVGGGWWVDRGQTSHHTSHCAP